MPPFRNGRFLREMPEFDEALYTTKSEADPETRKKRFKWYARAGRRVGGLDRAVAARRGHGRVSSPA